MGVDELEAGRQSYARREWEAAREHLTRADPARLGVDDLRALGSAAYLCGDRDSASRALQRAHSLNVASGDRLEAAIDGVGDLQVTIA